MALRLVDIVLPDGALESLKGVLREDIVCGGPWHVDLSRGGRLVRLLVDAKDSGRLIDAVEHRCGALPGFHLTIQAVEGALPRPPEPEEDPPVASNNRRASEANGLSKLKRLIFGSGKKRISREELYSDAIDMADATRIYFGLVVLSTVVAAVGLRKASPAILVGAMVIAPLLGPIVGMGLAATLADGKLARRAGRSALLGVVLALSLCALYGMLDPPDLGNGEIAARTHVDFGDLALALAAGSAGTLALTTGVSSALVGVMVAVALLPPTAVLGMCLGAGQMQAARGAALLLAVNVLGILLSAIVTFRMQGVRPGTWWEAKRARSATRWSILVLLALLAGIASVLGPLQ